MRIWKPKLPMARRHPFGDEENSHGVKIYGHPSDTESGHSAALNPECLDPGASQESLHEERHSHEEGLPHKH